LVDELAEVECILNHPLSLLVASRRPLAIWRRLGRTVERPGAWRRSTPRTSWATARSMGLSEPAAGPDAISSLERSYELSGGIPFTLGFLAYVYGRAGRSDDAKRLLDRAGELAAAGYVPPSAFAMGYVGLGDWDAAFHWLDRAVDGRDPIIMPMKTFPFLDPMRGDERYLALLSKMCLE
jgi:hypothetical protein